MIALLIKSSLVIAILLAFYKLFLEKESFFKNNRIYLFGGLIMAFTLPFITLPQLVSEQGIVSEMIEKMDDEKSTQETFVADTSMPTPKSIEENTPQNSPSTKNEAAEIAIPTTSNDFENTSQLSPAQSSRTVKDWLLFAYWFGVIVFSLHLITQIASLVFKIVKIDDKIEDEGAIIVNMPDAKEPFSFFNYIFINPDSYDYETYEQILTHEKIHVKQRHTLDLLLSEIVTIILWFNPLVWLFRKEVEKNIEYQTDDLLLKENADEKEFYQMNLVRIATYNRPLTVTTNYNQSLIKQRLLKMNSQKSTPHSYWKYAFIIPMIFGVLLVLNKPINALAQAGKTEITEAIVSTETEAPENIAEEKSNIAQKETKEPPSSKAQTKKVLLKEGNEVCENLKNAALARNSKEVYRIFKNENLTCLIKDGSNPTEVELVKESANLQVALMHIKDSGNISYEIDAMEITWDELPKSNESNCMKLYEAAQDGDLEEVRDILKTEDLTCLTMRDGSSSIYTNVLQNVVRLGGNVKIGNNYEITIWGLQMHFIFNDEDLESISFYKGSPSHYNYNNKPYSNNNRDSECCKLVDAIKNNELSKVKKLVTEDNLNCICQSDYVDENGKSNSYIQDFFTPLTASARTGNLEITKFLIDKGANINFKKRGVSVPFLAAAQGGNIDIVKLFLEKGANVNYIDEGHGSALMSAAREGKTNVINFLLKEGANINAINNGQGNALMCAARHGQVETTKLLLNKGADVNAINNGQGSALMCAARHGHEDVAELLVKKGANVNAINNGQGSALMCAARHGQLDMLNFLLKEGANINAINNGQGNTLMCAARHGHIDVAQFLIKKGVNVNAMNNGQGSALMCAARHGHNSMINLLLKNGAKINAANNGQGTALICAVRHDHFSTVKLLLEKGANPEITTQGQGSAISNAYRKNNKRIIDLLQQRTDAQ